MVEQKVLERTPELRQAWVEHLTLPFTSCVTLNSLIFLSFSTIISKMGITDTYLALLFQEA